jgi:hypothetical protein
MPPKERPPALAGKPAYEPALQTVFFEFWKGSVKQAGSFKLPNMTAEAALNYLTNGEVRLRFADPGI